MKISVVICTHNRAKLLEDALSSIYRSRNLDFDWELIVVDNNSTDNTKEVAISFKEKIGNFKYVFEKRQGISFAKNRGIKEVKGEIVVFTDDDVVVDPYWLKNIFTCFEADPGLSCIGGKILPLWETAPPKWLTKDFYPYLALLDYGDTVVEMNSPDLWGANFSVRKAMFAKYGLFDERIGRKGNQLYSGEETVFISRLIQNKEKVLYIPSVMVKHFVPKERMTKNYFRKWKFYHGKTIALLTDKESNKAKKIFNIPIFAIRSALLQLFKCLKSKLFFKSDSFYEELKLISTIGYIFKRLEFKS